MYTIIFKNNEDYLNNNLKNIHKYLHVNINIYV